MSRLALASMAGEVVLILDGVEHLGPEGQELLDLLVQDAPPQLHVVLAGRSKPVLPLSRLRLHRALLELRGDALRWTRRRVRHC